MSSETDPLLPKGSSAPEISGYGFSKPSKVKYQTESQIVDQGEDFEEREEQQPSPSSAGFSPLRTLISLFTIVVGLAIFITLLVPGAYDIPWEKPKNDTLTINARVDKILSKNPLIGPRLHIKDVNDIYSKDFTKKFENAGMPAHVDLGRLAEGQNGGAFWSAFTPCPKNGTDFSDANYVDAVSMTFSQLDLLRRLTAAYPKIFSPPHLNSTSALDNFKNSHQLISPIGVEGLHQIGNSVSNLRLFHSLGVKYATLTHNCNNAFADAALTTNSSGTTIAGPAHWGGLSDHGQLLIKEMNRMGMLIDLAHVSQDTMFDVLGGRADKFEGSKAPIMFSHSSAYALCPHPRNVPDEVLKLVKKTKSIVMVNFSPDFISCLPSGSSTGIPDLYPPNATLHQVARHITHIGDLIGYDYVGLGSDFDGIPTTPAGLDDVSKFPALIAELLRMGVSDADAAKIVGLNILRVWGDAEKVALDMQAAGTLPLQDKIEKMHFVV